MHTSPQLIDALEFDYLYIENSQLANAGKGLFTAIEIYKDEIISFFKGEILEKLEADYRSTNNQDKYFILMLDGTILDSMNVDCFAKYANDTAAFQENDFQNNSKIALDDDNNVCLIATKNIKCFEEIFCSYGKKYWKRHK
ncbi:SET domain-containing protein-lysine N-methyltransferase [Flavobacterium sp.]